MVTIYVLKLYEAKYYIGKTSKPVEVRYQEHLNGSGSAWTTRYKPIEIVKIIENASAFDEDRYTKEYMYEYGVDNVRGGSYVKMQLTASEKELIRKEIFMAKNLCIRCGRPSHYVKKCYAQHDVYGKPLQPNQMYEGEEETVINAVNTVIDVPDDTGDVICVMPSEKLR